MMKKSFNYCFALIAAAALFFSGCTLDTPEDNPAPENPVSDELAPTALQRRNILLEEYPGIICGWSPDGDKYAKSVGEALSGHVSIIAIHAGFYATPQPNKGYPDDYRTAFGDELIAQTGYTGIPAGTVSRHYFQGSSYQMRAGSMALTRTGWQSAAESFLDSAAAVNIGVRTKWNEATRTLDVTAETYYVTGDNAQNYLHIALVEDNLKGAQANFQLPSPYRDSTYIHNNVLRHLLTGQWGRLILETKQDSRWRETFSYHVPSKNNIANCRIIVFVTQGKREVLNVVETPAIR
jgi:hypothetical protein